MLALRYFSTLFPHTFLRHRIDVQQVVNVPSFVVRLDSQKHIDFALGSALAGGRPGRNRRKRAKAAEKGDDDAGDDEE